MDDTRIGKPRTPSKIRSKREILTNDLIDLIPTKDYSPQICLSKQRHCSTIDRYDLLDARRSLPFEMQNMKSIMEKNGHMRRHTVSGSSGVLLDKRKNKCHNNSNKFHVIGDGSFSHESQSSSSQFRPLSSSSSTSTGMTILSRNIFKMWKNQELCDIVIHVEGVKFYAHRLVLATVSDEFATLDDEPEKIAEYDVENVSAKCMADVLTYVYTSKIKIEKSNVEELLSISQQLGIHKLNDLCSKFLKNVSTNNVLKNREISEKFGMHEATSAIDKFVHSNFKSLVGTSEFLKGDYNAVYDLITSDALDSSNELEIFRACSSWLDYNRQNRLKYVVLLIGLVRFEKISPHELVDEVEPFTFIFDIPECKDMLYKAFRHHALRKDCEQERDTKANIYSKQNQDLSILNYPPPPSPICSKSSAINSNSSLSVNREVTDHISSGNDIPRSKSAKSFSVSKIDGERYSSDAQIIASESSHYKLESHEDHMLQNEQSSPPQSEHSRPYQSEHTRSFQSEHSRPSVSTDQCKSFKSRLLEARSKHSMAEDQMNVSVTNFKVSRPSFSSSSSHDPNKVNSKLLRQMMICRPELSGVKVPDSASEQGSSVTTSNRVQVGPSSLTHTEITSEAHIQSQNSINRQISQIKPSNSTLRDDHSTARDVTDYSKSSSFKGAKKSQTNPSVSIPSSKFSIDKPSGNNDTTKSQLARMAFEHELDEESLLQLDEENPSSKMSTKSSKHNRSGPLLSEQQISHKTINRGISGSRNSFPSDPSRKFSGEVEEQESEHRGSVAQMVEKLSRRSLSSGGLSRKGAGISTLQSILNAKSADKRHSSKQESRPSFHVNMSEQTNINNGAVKHKSQQAKYKYNAVFVLGGINPFLKDMENSNISRALQHFDPDSNRWSTKRFMPVALHDCAVSAIGNKLLVTGGQKSLTQTTSPSRDCYLYDIATDRWQKVGSLNTARTRHASVTVNKQIYVIGGEDRHEKTTTSVERYNVADDAWEDMECIDEPRVGLSAVAHKKKIIVVGGMSDIDSAVLTDSIETYDPIEDRWSKKSRFPIAVCGAAMVELGGAVYVVGGYVMRDTTPLSVDSVFKYRDEVDCWEIFQSLAVPRHDAVVAAIGSRLYVIGGESSATIDRALCDVECIDVTSNKHVPGVAAMLTTAYGMSGCGFVGKLSFTS